MRTKRCYLRTAGFSEFDKEMTRASQNGLIEVFDKGMLWVFEKGMLMELENGILRVSEKVGECFRRGC